MTHADASAPHFVFHEPPTLVAIAPNVWVVQDYHAQIFLVGDVYWHRYDGVWYRSVFYDDNWVVIPDIEVPPEIRDIDEGRYTNFKGEPGAGRTPAPPSHAAAQHGGPPGQRDEPGLRRGHEDASSVSMPGNSEGAPGHDADGPPGHSGEAPGQAKPEHNDHSGGKGPHESV